jgi:predicted alpha/beta superfamily hydrolase
VYLPDVYVDSSALRLPVLYMPDGGMREDFLHVAGLLEVSIGNGTMRPFILVGIENTERRRDLTGPTDVASDRKIAPRVGGSAAFRTFIRDELMPVVRARYRTTGETAVMGESLAGLFVVETLVREPDLFDSYAAFDPSLWWNGDRLVGEAAGLLRARPAMRKRIFLANSSEPWHADLTPRLAASLDSVPGIEAHFELFPAETHATIYHPAALRAVRFLFAPAGGTSAEYR